jgi:hypothetical protein
MIVPLALRWRAFYATRLIFLIWTQLPLNADTVFEFTQCRVSCIDTHVASSALSSSSPRRSESTWWSTRWEPLPLVRRKGWRRSCELLARNVSGSEEVLTSSAKRRSTREASVCRGRTTNSSSGALVDVSNHDSVGFVERHTARPTGAPLPAGLAIPEPGASAAATPPGALAPRRALASAGGGDSTEREMIWAPRTMVRPSVRFSSDSTRGAVLLLAPGAAAALVALRLTRLNSSVSARTRFMCYGQSALHSNRVFLYNTPYQRPASVRPFAAHRSWSLSSGS